MSSPGASSSRLFGTDGIRGTVNQFPMTAEISLALGKALGLLLRKKQSNSRVIIGKDTRLSCYVFENALIAGLCSMGVQTLMVGPLPTPGIAFITSAYRADAGIVISASHNPYSDNGIKIFSSDGFKISEELERELESLIEENNFEQHLPSASQIGKNSKIDDASGRYIEFTKATFPKALSLKEIKIALDCAHGASYRVAPLVFGELDAKVYVYGAHPDGLNINRKVGAIHPEVIQKAVIEHRADVGIALDGDGDRIIMVDEQAQIINGDTLLAICARNMKQCGRLKQDCVVGTVMTNWGVIKTLKEWGIELIQAPVGDRYVIREMISRKVNLGGEQSGHLIFSDHNTTGDGIIAALQVLAIMKEHDLRLSELSSSVKNYPQVLLNVPVQKKVPLGELEPLSELIARIETELGERGKVLLRYSGTESICRILVEGKKKKEIHAMASQLRELVLELIG